MCVPLEKAWLCYYKGLIMHSRDCYTAAMLSVDMTFLLITNSGSNTFSYSSFFLQIQLTKSYEPIKKIQCFQVQKNRDVHKFKLNIYHIHY